MALSGSQLTGIGSHSSGVSRKRTFLPKVSPSTIAHAVASFALTVATVVSISLLLP